MKRKKEVTDSPAGDQPIVNFFWPPITTDVESSVQYMKRLTVAAVSHVIHSRMSFEDEYFEEHTLGYLRLKILKDKCIDRSKRNCPCVVCLLRNCLAIIDKKKLKYMYLSVHKTKNGPGDYYTMHYKYDTDGFNISLNTKSPKEQDSEEEVTVMAEKICVPDIRQSMEQLLRTIELQCKDKERLAPTAWYYLEIDTYDQFEAKGFPNPVFGRKHNAIDVMDIHIDGHNDSGLSATDNKFRPYIKKEIKTEIKTEPEV